MRRDRQRQGLGRQLIDYLDSKYEMKKDLVVVQTRAMSEGFYERLGWVTVASTDLDLSEWDVQGRGYGVHRSPQMLRQPEKKV